VESTAGRFRQNAPAPDGDGSFGQVSNAQRPARAVPDFIDRAMDSTVKPWNDVN
jgi:hypothetical protein